MKTLLTLCTTLLLAAAALPLREWSELDRQRAPVNRWLWLRSEIVEQPQRRIDYAFTGSSKTLSGIRPSRIAERYPGTIAFNFAHFGWGHDADYFVARPLLEGHDVGTLVIELPLKAPGKPHPETVHLVGARELGGELRSAVAELGISSVLRYDAALKERISRISRYAATSLFSFPRHALEWAFARATGRSWEYESSQQFWELGRGYAVPLEKKQADPAFRERQTKGSPLPSRPPRDQARVLPGPRNVFYLERLRDLAAAHGTRLVFLHVPSWRKHLPTRAQHRFYSQFGEVVIPDLERLQEPDYYVDPWHILHEGTNVFTDDVMRLLVEGTEGTFYNELYRSD